MPACGCPGTPSGEYVRQISLVNGSGEQITDSVYMLVFSSEGQQVHMLRAEIIPNTTEARMDYRFLKDYNEGRRHRLYILAGLGWRPVVADPDNFFAGGLADHQQLIESGSAQPVHYDQAEIVMTEDATIVDEASVRQAVCKDLEAIVDREKNTSRSGFYKDVYQLFAGREQHKVRDIWGDKASIDFLFVP